jgi:hypothetical protein
MTAKFLVLGALLLALCSAKQQPPLQPIPQTYNNHQEKQHGRGDKPPQFDQEAHNKGVADTLKILDKDGDGQVSLSEFSSHSGHSEQDSHEYFTLVDQDGNGLVSLAEAKRASEAESSGKRSESFMGEFYTKWSKKSSGGAPPQKAPELLETKSKDHSMPRSPNFGGSQIDSFPSIGCFWTRDNPSNPHDIWGCCYPGSRGLWCRNSEWCITPGCAWQWLYSSQQEICASGVWDTGLGWQKYGFATANECSTARPWTWTYSCASIGMQPSCGWGVRLMCADPDQSTGGAANGNPNQTGCWNCLANC